MKSIHTIAVFCPHIGSGEYASCNQRIEIKVTEYSADFFNPWQLGYALPSHCPAGHTWSKQENYHLQAQVESEFEVPRQVPKHPDQLDDVHQATADRLGVDRERAKVINFGILYGKHPTQLDANILLDDLLGWDSR